MALSGFSGNDSNWTFGSSTFHGVRSGRGLTDLQLLQLLHESRKKPKRSFVQSLKDVGSAVADPVVWTLDKLMRPSYAVANAVDKGVAYHHLDVGDLLHGAREGFMGREKTGFGEVLKHKGLLQGHGRLRGVTGFALDVATDPTTYLTAGSTGAIKSGTRAAAKAGEGVLKDAITIEGKHEASARLRELKPLVEELRTGGRDFSERRQLGELKLDLLRKQSFGAPLTEADRTALSVARAGAFAESRQGGRRLTLGVGGMSTRTPIPLPKMETLAKVPLLGKPVEGLGKAFVPGYGREVEHAKLMARKHAGEQLAERYVQFARAAFDGVSHLSDDEQRAALHFFEKKGGVIEQDGQIVLNPKRIEEAKAAGVSDQGIEFAQAMHGVSEFLHGEHGRYGVEVGHLGKEKGQLYVPHKYTPDGRPLTQIERNMLSTRGFTKGRTNEFSVKELHDMKAAGQLPKGVETSPYRLLTHHLRAAANQHADRALLNHAADVYGTSSRLVDSAALRAAQGKLDDVLRQLGAHPGASEESFTDAVEALRLKHESAAREAFHAAHANDRALIKKHLEGDWTRTTMATVQRISKRNATRQQRLADELGLIRRGEHKGLAKEMKALTKEREVQAREFQALSSQAAKLEKQVKKLRRGKAAPGGENLVEIPKLTDEHGHPLRLPREIAEPILKMEKVIAGDDEVIEAFGRAYRKYLGKWKVGVTSINPGYGIRNTLSDMWNMWLAGVPLNKAVAYGGRAAKVMRQAKTGDARSMSILVEAYHQGVLSGLFQGDVQAIEAMIRNAGSKRALVKNGRFLALGSKVMQDINRNRENWGRLTHYLYRREGQGMGVAEAAHHVRVAHFDYEDLTEFERRWAKSIAPFYTWARKNVPFQLKSIVAAPGRMAAFPKFANEMEGDSGAGDIVPDYLSRGMAIKIGGKYVNPAIGITDLEKLNPANAGETISSLLGPQFKVPIELLTNKSLLTGQPIVDKTSHPRKPVNDALAGLLSFLPGSNVGVTERNGVSGAGIDPRYSYALGQLPLTNWLFNQQGKIKGSQTGDLKRLGYLTGISAQDLNQDQQKTIEALNERDAFQGFLRGLRDEGVVPEPKKKKRSAAQKQLDEILYAQLSGR